jgi:oligogalacturonide transporter
MTLDYNERTALSSARIFFSTFSSIIAALLPLEIVKRSTDVQQGYILMGLVFGAFFALPFVATVITAREGREFQKPPEKFNLRDTLLEPFKIRTFVLALGMFLFTFIAADTVSSIMVYFMKYYLQRGDEANYVAGTMLVFQVISLVFFTEYTRRTNKRVGLITGLVIWMVTMAFSLLLRPGNPALAVYLFAAMVGIGTGGMYLNIYAILPDLPDVDELRTGERREGVFGALITLMRKTSSAAGIFIVSNILGAAGYAQPVEQVVNGTARLIDQPQSEGFILVLRLIFALFPTVLLSIAILIAVRYPLTGSIHARLNRVLASRREGEAETIERRDEADELERILI